MMFVMITLANMEIAQRLREMDGMEEILLVRLARCNPTLLQMELLGSVVAVRAFVDSMDNNGVGHYHNVYAITLAQFATLQPTPEQRRILCTAESIKEFVRLHVAPSAQHISNPVGALRELVTPTIPCYTYETDEHGLFVCYCTVHNICTHGRAAVKRTAKMQAALAMLTSWVAPQTSGNGN